MPKIKKLGIIGHFGGDKEFFDGQTIKTKILYEELKKATDWKIKKVDTYYKTTNKIKLIWQTFKCLFSTKHIIVLLSGNGMKTYFPILHFFSKVFHTRIYHNVIGGNLDVYVKENPKFKKYLNSFKVNWVETQNLKERLDSLGITTAETLPNFKKLTIVDETRLKGVFAQPYKLCTFSRVCRQKGIGDAVDAVIKANEHFGRTVYTLDIYGQIDNGEQEWFDDLKNSFPDCVQYKGIVPFDKSVEVLKEYFALLFPTKYYTEGVPGTIIDAFAAGLPIISTVWVNYSDILDEKTAIGYTFGQEKELIEILKDEKISERILPLKKNCINRAKDYLPNKVIEKIILRING